MRPLRMLSSYDPTMGACCRGEASEIDGRRAKGDGDIGRPDMELMERRGWCAWYGNARNEELRCKSECEFLVGVKWPES
jgi:hypothetical protein